MCAGKTFSPALLIGQVRVTPSLSWAMGELEFPGVEVQTPSSSLGAYGPFLEGVAKSLGRTSGPGHHPYTTLLQCPLPPQLFLCCLLNLQESGLLCEVRPGLGRR